MRISGRRHGGLLVAALCLVPPSVAGCRRRRATPPSAVLLPTSPVPRPIEAHWGPPTMPTDSPSAAFTRPRSPAGSADGLDAGTLNGHPRGPRAADLDRVVAGLAPALRGCLDALPDREVGSRIEVQLAYQVEPAGQVSQVTVEGNAPAPARACLERTTRGAVFPAFAGAAVSGSVPYSYSRTTAAPDGGAGGP